MTNAEFELAEQFALYTRKNSFITGKAGTGKTTLLKRIVGGTEKNTVVVAPTGVAAINAGGVTIHSMFGLPLTCFLPSNDFAHQKQATNRRELLEHHMHFRKDKLRVFQELELLIIDEVSMVRSDVLDAVDFVLRTVRRNRKPFGDVQVLLFGDMHQLPPVAKEPEWGLMKSYYRSPYFFDSLVWPQLDAAEIELKTIYRQNDARFLTLLSHIRERRMDEEDFEKLRERYNPGFHGAGEGYVLLSTHNYRADGVNESELAKLPGRLSSFEAEIEGEFPENMYPCDRLLRLKVGAQVMFIRNDTEQGRYYNGKLAVVKRIDGDRITVTFSDSGRDYLLRREKWENVEYSIDEETGKLVRDEIGFFSQFPLRLAWAITIHKSQGLTFDKVIVDAGRSFAAGQVYVALSRCRSLEGIVLHSLITPAVLHDDQRISEFSSSNKRTENLHETLVLEKRRYAWHLLLRLFTFSSLQQHLPGWLELINKKDIPDKEAALALHARISGQLDEISSTAGKFQNQLQRIMSAMEKDPAHRALLRERCAKAIEYFTGQIATGIIAPMAEHINLLAYKKKMKRYLRQVQLVENACWAKVEQLYKARFMDERLYSGGVVHKREDSHRVVSSATSGKKGKGGTYRDTLALHKQGKSMEEIASIRGLALSTITDHVSALILQGEIKLGDILPAETINNIMAFLQEQDKGNTSLTEIRTALDNRYEFADIKLVRSHFRRVTGKISEAGKGALAAMDLKREPSANVSDA